MGPTPHEAERLWRTVRLVAAAVNLVLPQDAVPRLTGHGAAERGPSCRFFPNRRLLLAVDYLFEPVDPEVTANRLVDRGLLRLSDPAKTDCSAAVVGWIDLEGGTGGAALDLRPPGERILVAGSWQPRHLWSRPAPDPDQTPESALQGAVALVKEQMERGLVLSDAHDRKALDGALKFCVACFKWAGGVPPAAIESYPTDRDKVVRIAGDFHQAAEAERLRLFPNVASRPVHQPSAGGVLAGVRVSISYAMPTNVQLARPLKRALESNGASIWFDQTVRPDSTDLAEGLRHTIAGHDVFLLCASHELFENAATRSRSWPAC